jgi:hypothetical protein
MKNKSIGILGVLIPYFFLIGFTIYYLLFNLKAFKEINKFSLVFYNSSDFLGTEWTAYFNYGIIGLTIIIFMTTLIFTTSNSGLNLWGKSLLLISGISWATLGLLPYSGNKFDHVMFLTFITLLCGSTGYIVLSMDFEKIIGHKRLNKIILWHGLIIIIESVVQIIIIDDINNYPNIVSKIIWFIYFLGFGIIGYALIKKT